MDFGSGILFLDLKTDAGNMILGGIVSARLHMKTAAVDSVAGLDVTIDAGGVVRHAVLDAKGRAKIDGATFKFLPATAKKPRSFSITVTGADIGGALADEGMDGTVAAAKEMRHMVVKLTIAGEGTHSYTLDLIYSAIPGKKATATLAK